VPRSLSVEFTGSDSSLLEENLLHEEGKARVLTKAQQVIMDLWVRDDAKFVNILHNIMGLGRTNALTNSGVPMGTSTQVMPATLIMSVTRATPWLTDA
jgi:hypothetical protein